MNQPKHFATASGTGNRAAAELVDATAGIASHGRIQGKSLLVDPGIVGTGVQVTLSVNGVTKWRVSVTVAEGARWFPLWGVDNRGGQGVEAGDIDLQVAATATTEEWFVSFGWDGAR